MTKPLRVAFVLAGVAALVLKRHVPAAGMPLVFDHGGNVAASFAVYFIVSMLPLIARRGRLATAAAALGVVELFEATDGFGVMTNVYDPVDFAANAVGVGLALAAEGATRALKRKVTEPGGGSG